jgi:hypothetical protein
MIDWFRSADGILSFYGALSPKIACIWLSVWAIRKKAEVDVPLDSYARAVRCTVVVVGFVFGYIADFKYLRLGSGFVGLVFLCWPNCGHYLVNLFKSSLAALRQPQD